MGKKAIAGLFLLAGLLYNASAVAFADATSARAAYAIDRATGRPLFAVNENTQMPMASTTKVMTALVALENGDLSSLVETGPNAYGRPGTSIYLGLGEKLTLEQMLYGLMIASGNDAAVAIAEHVGGSVGGFCAMMDERARTLGAASTHFVNPNGLPATGHVTTAHDLTLIAAKALEYPMFRDIVSTQRASLPWEGRAYMRVLRNKNALLSSYEGATGVKTGFTKGAGRCLVFSAQRGDFEIVGVVLNCSDWFDEAARILDDCFERYTWHAMLDDGAEVGVATVEGGEIEQVRVVVSGALAAPVLENEMPRVTVEIAPLLEAPLPKGAEVGWATMYAGETLLAKRPLVLAEAVPKALSPWQRWLRRFPMLAD